jgi:hypothetical protein
MINSYIIVVGRPMGRGEDNFKMDLREIVCEGFVWIQLAQDNTW